jgi:hypothetical protein|nr:hypothetical protein Q903MT_gene3647 [Picea sitchensis]
MVLITLVSINDGPVVNYKRRPSFKEGRDAISDKWWKNQIRLANRRADQLQKTIVEEGSSEARSGRLAEAQEERYTGQCLVKRKGYCIGRDP